MKDESRTAAAWKSAELAQKFISGVRGAIPLAAEQIAVIQFLVRHWRPDFGNFLDLGCGDGILGRALLAVNPGAEGVFLDFSGAMLDAARKACPQGAACRFVSADLSDASWLETLPADKPFDIVVSGLMIHHQSDERKREIYREIYGLLAPGGVFLHLEHVSSPGEAIRAAADEFFIDALYEHHRRTGGAMSREEVAKEFFNRPDKEANILAPVEDQLAWLRGIGFRDVDCFLKLFELTVFGGRKPENV